MVPQQKLFCKLRAMSLQQQDLMSSVSESVLCLQQAMLYERTPCMSCLFLLAALSSALSRSPGGGLLGGPGSSSPPLEGGGGYSSLIPASLSDTPTATPEPLQADKQHHNMFSSTVKSHLTDKFLAWSGFIPIEVLAA